MSLVADFATRMADVARQPRADLEMTAILLAIGVVIIALLVLIFTLSRISASSRRAARSAPRDSDQVEGS